MECSSPQTTDLKPSPHFYLFANKEQFDIFCRRNHLSPNAAAYFDRNDKAYGIEAGTFHKIVGIGPDVDLHIMASRGFKHD